MIAAPGQTTSVAAFPDVAVQGPQPPVPVGTAAFPDVEPPAPKPPTDPLLTLLGEDPYAVELAAAVRAQNEGDDVSPYARLIRESKVTEAPLDNPYIDELRLMTSEGSDADNPYAAARGR